MGPHDFCFLRKHTYSAQLLAAFPLQRNMLTQYVSTIPKVNNTGNNPQQNTEAKENIVEQNNEQDLPPPPVSLNDIRRVLHKLPRSLESGTSHKNISHSCRQH